MGWIWALHGVMTILFIIFIIYTISYSINYSKYGKRTVRDIAKIEFDSPVTTYYLDSATGEKRKRVFYKSKLKYGYVDGANYRYTRSGLNFNIAFAVILPVVYIILAAIYHWIMGIPVDQEVLDDFNKRADQSSDGFFKLDKTDLNYPEYKKAERRVNYPFYASVIFGTLIMVMILFGSSVVWSAKNWKYYITKTEIYNEKDELIDTIIDEKY